MTPVNFTTVFKTFKGETMRLNDISQTLGRLVQTCQEFFDGKTEKEAFKSAFDSVLEDNPELTLRDVCLTAIANPQQGEKDGTKKFRKGLMARMIAKNDVLELAAEDITLLKQTVNEAYATPLIVWNAWSILDPRANEQNPRD